MISASYGKNPVNRYLSSKGLANIKEETLKSFKKVLIDEKSYIGFVSKKTKNEKTTYKMLVFYEDEKRVKNRKKVEISNDSQIYDQVTCQSVEAEPNKVCVDDKFLVQISAEGEELKYTLDTVRMVFADNSFYAEFRDDSQGELKDLTNLNIKREVKEASGISIGDQVAFMGLTRSLGEGLFVGTVQRAFESGIYFVSKDFSEDGRQLHGLEPVKRGELFIETDFSKSDNLSDLPTQVTRPTHPYYNQNVNFEKLFEAEGESVCLVAHGEIKFPIDCQDLR